METGTNIEQLRLEAQERRWQLLDQERADLEEWLDMPAGQTWSEIQRLLRHYRKRPQKSALFIQLRVIAPFIDWKRSWRCWLELVDEHGKLVDDYKRHASAHYCEEIFTNKEWKEYTVGGGTSFFLLPVGNAVKEKKPKVVKPKKPKPVRHTGDTTLLSILCDDLPNPWPVDPVPSVEPEETVVLPAWMLSLIDDDTSNPLGNL